MTQASEATARDAEIARLRSIPAFAPLSDGALAVLLAQGEPVRFAAGDVLIRQTETHDMAFVLFEGEVAVVNETGLGEVALARVAGPALVGEIAALARVARTATVRAVTPVRALRIERAALVEACRDNPDLLITIIAHMANQIQGVNHVLGLYAGGFAALEREDFDPAILAELNNPTPELSGFAAAFQSLARHILHERRNRREMASAALIQRAMLPQALAGLDPKGRCEVFGDMVSARDVGGDLYDVFMLGPDHLALVIGDVCGKGVPASLFMSVTMTVLRLAARSTSGIAATLELANAMLHAQNPSALFATVFHGVLDLNTGRLDYGVCGHNAPIVLRRDGALAPLAGSGTPLGMFPDKTVRAHTLDLAPGDSLFLYTDGVTESVDAAGVEFGDARLGETLGRLAGSGPLALCRAIMAEVARHAEGQEPFDDITCLALRWTPPESKT